MQNYQNNQDIKEKLKLTASCNKTELFSGFVTKLESLHFQFEGGIGLGLDFKSHLRQLALEDS
jgi:hypothetical protein